jgi:hypothetical protein
VRVTLAFGLILGMAGTGADLHAQGVAVRGAVFQDNAQGPADGAVVTVKPEGIDRRVDATGAFRFDALAIGHHTLTIRCIGFRPLTVELELTKGDTLVDVGPIVLAPAVRVLDPVVVEAERMTAQLQRVGFYARREDGAGAFVTREEFEAWTPRQVTDVLRHVPGVMVRSNPNYGGKRAVRRSALGYALEDQDGRDLRRTLVYTPRAPNAEQCPPLYFIDGTFAGNAADADIDARLSAASLDAVEFYAGTASVPSQFNRTGAACGVFAFWTRSGR